MMRSNCLRPSVYAVSRKRGRCSSPGKAEGPPLYPRKKDLTAPPSPVGCSRMPRDSMGDGLERSRRLLDEMHAEVEGDPELQAASPKGVVVLSPRELGGDPLDLEPLDDHVIVLQEEIPDAIGS